MHDRQPTDRADARFRAERFLTENTFNWGCDKEVDDGIGFKGGRTVMLPALKLLFYLGVRTVTFQQGVKELAVTDISLAQ